MAAYHMNVNEKRELDKFSKFLVYKCIQIIVQARLGEKRKTFSKPVSSGQDWEEVLFNVAVKDMPEITAESRKVYTSSTLIYEKPINVQISLRTPEGETMMLEEWSLAMDPEVLDKSRVHYTVYNRMGVLLKSLLCVSRATPAYKLSRNQGPDTHIVLYRIYTGEPEGTRHLGAGYSERRVGAVPTPCGTIELKLHYRTRILFSPHQSTLSIELKDDHFTDTPLPATANNARPCQDAQRRRQSTTTPDGESEYCATEFSTSPVTPYRSPGRQRKTSAGQVNGDAHKNGHDNVSKSPSKGTRFGGFAAPTITEQPKVDDDIPFAALLVDRDSNANKKPLRRHDDDEDEDEDEEDVVDNDEAGRAARWRRRRHLSADSGSNSQHSNSQHADDFVMVELKTPFAGQDGLSEVSRFLRDCQGAPPLHHHCTDIAEEDNPKHFLNNITDQLSHFETQQAEFNLFLKDLLVDDE